METVSMNDKTYRRPVQWSSYGNTDKGTVRKVNEDSICVREEIRLWAVADGLGGHAVGDIASRMITDTLTGVVGQQCLNDMVLAVEDKLLDANQAILDYSATQLDRATMGSTIVSLLIHGRVGVCFWAGDSRLYHYRQGELRQLTRDHSQVEEWVQQGLLSPEEGANHPRSNVITRALGVDEEVDIDLMVFDAGIGDTFLLCSDGLYNAVDKDTIKAGLSHRTTQDSADELLQMAMNNGASDNVSVIVVKGEPGQTGA